MTAKGAGCTVLMVLFCLSAVATPLWFFMIAPQIRHERLVEKGIQVPGRLLDVDESGTMINKVHELELTVEFMRKDGVLDTAVCDFLPERRVQHMFQPGVGLTAVYDPADPEEITIVAVSNMPAGIPNGPDGASIINPTVDSLRRATDSLARQLQEMKAQMEKRK